MIIGRDKRRRKREKHPVNLLKLTNSFHPVLASTNQGQELSIVLEGNPAMSHPSIVVNFLAALGVILMI